MIRFFWPRLDRRSYEPELMDDPECDTRKLINTVRQFAFINVFFTASHALLKKYVIGDMMKDRSKSYSFIDLGAGGGDLAIWLVKQARRLGIRLSVVCLDYDKRIVDYARHHCGRFEEIKVIHGSAFELEKLGQFDYMFANHFLHHFDEAGIEKIIKGVCLQTKRLFLFNDLKRSGWAYLGYTLFTGIFLHNSFAFYDGRLSIKRGFLARELFGILKECCGGIAVKSAFPARLYVVGEPGENYVPGLQL